MASYVNMNVFLIVIVVAVAGCSGAVIYYGESQSIRGQIEEVTNGFSEDLSTLTSQTSNTIANLTTNFTQHVATVNNQMSLLQSELTVKTNELAVITAERSTIKSRVTSLYSQLNSTTTTNTSRVLNWTESAKNNISELLNDTILVDLNMTNLKVFLNNNSVNNHTYNISTYNCVDFSKDLIDNATEKNIRSALVLIDGTNESHAIVGFNTTNLGLVYIEPQSDLRVNFTIGVIPSFVNASFGPVQKYYVFW